jgi:hypothetical protein
LHLRRRTTQFVDVPLPFVNQQLEAARRTYMEKHPLGRDKDQLARLRQEPGKPLTSPAPGGTPAPQPAAAAAAASAAAAAQQQGADAAAGAGGVKAERVVEYAVASSSALVSAPAALALRSGADAQPGADRGQPAAGGGQKAQKGGAAGGGAAGRPGAGPPPNTLRLSVRPSGTGLYPARVTLSSPGDVRVLAVEISAQCLGQSYALELECPARQQVRMLLQGPLRAAWGCRGSSSCMVCARGASKNAAGP